MLIDRCPVNLQRAPLISALRRSGWQGQPGFANGLTNKHSTVATVENRIASNTVLAVLFSVTVCHMINDTLQALMLAIYPILRNSYALPLARSGSSRMVFQVIASILQPLIGLYTDRRPMPYSLPLAPAFTLLGVVRLGLATSYTVILVAAAAVGIGSAIFHPAGVARGAHRFGRALRHGAKPVPGGRHFGSSLGPLLAAWIILPRGQPSLVWFGVIALAAVGILSDLGRWYSHHLSPKTRPPPPAIRIRWVAVVSLSLLILLALMFSKFVYTSSFSSFYTFYLIDHFQVPVKDAQIYLFVLSGRLCHRHICRGVPLATASGARR